MTVTPQLELHISGKLKQALPPLTQEELQALEENIVRDGRVLNRILYWHDGEHAVIVDGMNRYPIAKRHGLPYEASGMEFGCYEEAILWIKKHALGQRNLTVEWKRRLIGEVYNGSKGPRGGATSERSNVAAQIAAEANVSPGTVVRHGKIVEAMGKFPVAMRDSIDNGEHPATDKMILALARIDRHNLQKIWADVRMQRQPNYEAAAKAHGIKLKDEPTVWDNIRQAFHEQLKEMKAPARDLKRLSELNMDQQAEVMANIDGRTLKEAIALWEGPVADEGDGQPAPAPIIEPEPEPAPAETIKQHLNGMKATVDKLRVRIDEIVAEVGRPDPDYAQQILDGLEQARVALAKWARKA